MLGQASTIAVELTPEVKHAKQVALESTGVFAGKSQELDFTLYSPIITLS
jgi:hypothetical protein